MKPAGWCGTCDPIAKSGEPGFCDRDEPNQLPKNPSELLVPEHDKNWGFCSDSCNKDKFAHAIYLSNMYVLDEPMCKESGDNMNTPKMNMGVDSTIELCASFARKLKAEVVTWKLDKDKYTFTAVNISKEDAVKFPSKRANKSALDGDTVMGGVDTCQGDSGGPLWVTLKNNATNTSKAYLVGVVSRGRILASTPE